MNQNRFLILLSALFFATMVVGLVISPDLVTQTYAQDDAVLTAVPVEEAPTLDGVVDEAIWADAPQVEIPVRRGANHGETTVILRSVYTEDMVYFLATWEDPTQSFLRSPWEMQADGTWIQLRDPEDQGGDNNLWYEST